jgi:hypothetical protein
VSAVKHSGYELVRRGPRKGKLATYRDLAAMDFKAWKRPRGMKPGQLIPSDTDFQRCGVSARLAYAIMLRTRDELIDMHKRVDHAHVDQMMTNIFETTEWLKTVVALLDMAYMRVLASASANLVRKGKFKGVAA